MSFSPLGLMECQERRPYPETSRVSVQNAMVDAETRHARTMSSLSKAERNRQGSCADLVVFRLVVYSAEI